MRNLLEEKRDASTAWLERTNPLVGMSISDLQLVFDAARGGDTQRLHWIFSEIECVNPTLLVCVERRASAIANFSWAISERASMDGALSAEQKDAAERFLGDIENFTEALEHLDLAFFRGFSHVQPIWRPDGTVRRIALLDSWNFVRRDGEWYFNPRCTGLSARDLVDCRDARLMSVVRANRRHVDYPALGVHVRDAVGNRDWGRFLERHALPKPAVTMHPGATRDDRAEYLHAAECVEDGQVSVWPNGASLTDFAGGSRGVDPFSSFVKHQEETMVRLATGGTLGSIAESGAGTLAGNAQADVWRSIVSRDAGVLARAVTGALVRPYLEAAFPGRPVAVDFAFDFSEKPTPKEIFEMQALAKQGGYSIALDELEEGTGFTLEKLPETAPQTPFGGLALNADPATPLQNAVKPLQNAPKILNAQGDGNPADASTGVLEAFAEDTSKAAERVRALKADPTPDAAKALLEDLPSLIPDDPALAAVIAEAMAAEFRSHDASAPSGATATAENMVDDNGMEHAGKGEGGGQFVKQGEGGASTDIQVSEAKPTTSEYRKLADAVPQSRISEICTADLNQYCSIEEAIAVLRTNPKVKNAYGEDVTFGSDMIDKYLSGRGRTGNTADPDRLKELQIAMYAVKHDRSPKLQYLRGAIHDPFNPPRGTQRVYTVQASNGPMLARAWADSGKVTGWYVETKKPTNEGGGRKRA